MPFKNFVLLELHILNPTVSTTIVGFNYNNWFQLHWLVSTKVVGFNYNSWFQLK